jgi:uncharacterized protein
MEINPMETGGSQVVQSYGGGGFTVSDVRYTGSMLVFPERTLSWPPKAFTELAADHLAPLLEAPEPLDVVLIGAGPDLTVLPPDLSALIRDAGLGFEVMSTGAACRTFNVLLSGERLVAAALIAVD